MMNNNELSFVIIDEDGQIIVNNQMLSNVDQGCKFLDSLEKDEHFRYLGKWGESKVLIEVFDEPLIARDIFFDDSSSTWKINCNYGYEAKFNLETLSLDEWDRFHGQIQKGISFVMTSDTQDKFFNLLDEFDDESITFNNKKIQTPPWFIEESVENNESFWTQKYEEQFTPWDLNDATPALKDTLPQLKIPKQRVLVLGCGTGNDARFFAEQGHIVTGLDISPKAIELAKERNQQMTNLDFIVGDVFNVPKNLLGQFDLIFEHTCYCAISPFKRNQLVQSWKKLLSPSGHLLAVFFVFDKKNGPPYGGSEWEVRKRLSKHFNFLYWTRWKHSKDSRQGSELLVYAQLKNSI